MTEVDPAELRRETFAHARQLAEELAAGHPGYQGQDRDELLPWQREQLSMWALNLESCLARFVPTLLARLDEMEAAAAGMDEAYETVVAANRRALRERDEARVQRDGLDAGYAEARRLLRRIVRDQCGSDFVDPEVGGAFAVCADMDAVELAAWLGAELKEPGSAVPPAEPEWRCSPRGRDGG